MRRLLALEYVQCSHGDIRYSRFYLDRLVRYLGW